MSAKLRIKAKGIEIEWEGDVDYLKNDLPELISAIVIALGPIASDETQDARESGEDKPGASFTTASLAAKLGPKAAPELFKIALAKLQISDKIEPASRAQILGEMRNAPKFFNPNMVGNLSKTIDKLLSSGEINEPSSGNYALAQAAQDIITSRI